MMCSLTQEKKVDLYFKIGIPRSIESYQMDILEIIFDYLYLKNPAAADDSKRIDDEIQTFFQTDTLKRVRKSESWVCGQNVNP